MGTCGRIHQKGVATILKRYLHKLSDHLFANKFRNESSVVFFPCYKTMPSIP